MEDEVKRIPITKPQFGSTFFTVLMAINVVLLYVGWSTGKQWFSLGLIFAIAAWQWYSYLMSKAAAQYHTWCRVLYAVVDDQGATINKQRLDIENLIAEQAVTHDGTNRSETCHTLHEGDTK